jgi:hypothetical protein
MRSHSVNRDIPDQPQAPTSWSAELQTDIDGLPILLRFLIKEAPKEMQIRISLKSCRYLFVAVEHARNNS